MTESDHDLVVRQHEARLARAIVGNGALFFEMSEAVPDVCRPHQAELDLTKVHLGCITMATILATTIIKVEKGFLTEREAVEDVRRNPTCDKCAFSRDD